MRSHAEAGHAATSPQGREADPGKTRTWRNLLLTFPFLLFFYVQLVHHALWRDELNAFGIAAGSPSLGSLLSNVRYEGHPWLWYVLLWFISKLTHDPVGMKWLQAAIGTAIYLVLGLLSPFRWWEKLLLFLSYYIAFEYTVLSRMYGIVVLLAMLYLLRRQRQGASLAGNAILLGLMACTDLTGILLSFAFVAEYLYSLRRPGMLAPSLPSYREFFASGGIYIACLSLAVLSLLPQPDASSKAGEGLLYGYTRHDYHLLRVLVSDVVVPYFPTWTGVQGIFWDTVVGAHIRLFAACLPLVLLAYWLVLRRYRNLAVLLTADIFLTVSFGYLIYLGKPRHYGMTFLAFVACLWLLRAAGKTIHPAAYALLALSAAGGIHAMASWQRPFSNAQATAAWLKQSGYNRLPLVGSQDYTVFGVAVALDQPMYMLDCRCERSFLRINAERDGYNWDMLPERLPGAQAALRATSMVLVTAHPINTGNANKLASENFSLAPLQQFLGSEIPEDNFYVYLVKAEPMPSQRR